VYEFTWKRALAALKAASTTGDVRLVVHGRNDDTTAASKAAVAAAGLDGVVTWRTAANSSALQHNKFLVLTHHGKPVAVWTGSLNITQGAVYGHSNLAHLIHDPDVAAAFAEYWDQLADQHNTTPVLRTWTGATNPVDTDAAHAPVGATTVFSPRTGLAALNWYADLFNAAKSSAHITGAFGLNKVFRELLAADLDLVRTVLLDKKPPANQQLSLTDPDVRVSWGSKLTESTLDGWAKEHLTGFNPYVKYVHTKIILIDPLTEKPTTVTGSANYSDNSTAVNEENTVIISGAHGTHAAKRVADIYLTEYHRIFQHFVFRDIEEAIAAAPAGGRLVPNDTWTAKFYEAGSWRQRQRRLFAGT